MHVVGQPPTRNDSHPAHHDNRPAHKESGPAGPCGQILVTRVGLQIPTDITYEDWENAGGKLARISDTSAWCLGDWLVHGQACFRQRYQLALKRAGLDYQTLRNYAWVARKFPPGRRRNKLSFQHHAEVASLDPAEQDHWLRQAEANEWSRNELRLKVRAAAGRAGPPAVGGAVVVPRLAVTPDALQLWRAAAERSCTSLEGWLVATLNDAAAEALGEDAGMHGPGVEAAGSPDRPATDIAS